MFVLFRMMTDSLWLWNRILISTFVRGNLRFWSHLLHLLYNSLTKGRHSFPSSILCICKIAIKNIFSCTLASSEWSLIFILVWQRYFFVHSFNVRQWHVVFELSDCAHWIRGSISFQKIVNYLGKTSTVLSIIDNLVIDLVDKSWGNNKLAIINKPEYFPEMLKCLLIDPSHAQRVYFLPLTVFIVPNVHDTLVLEYELYTFIRVFAFDPTRLNNTHCCVCGSCFLWWWQTRLNLLL